jgi:hypothetical protein
MDTIDKAEFRIKLQEIIRSGYIAVEESYKPSDMLEATETMLNNMRKLIIESVKEKK